MKSSDRNLVLFTCGAIVLINILFAWILSEVVLVSELNAEDLEELHEVWVRESGVEGQKDQLQTSL